MITEA